VTDLDFPVEIDEDSFLVNVMRSAPKTDYLTGVQYLRQAYEVTFGIHDHIQQFENEQQNKNPELARPLSSVAIHHAEDLSKSSRFQYLYKRFAKLEIGQKFNVTLPQFIKLPHEHVMMLFSIAEALLEEDNKRAAEIKKQLEASQGPPKIVP
jgi:hypothetical protein